MPEINPRERLLALYERIAELRRFREEDDAQMTPAERRESDLVIAQLEDAATAFKEEHRLEIWTEDFAETLSRMVAYQKEAEALRLVNDHTGADEALQNAHEMSILCGLLIGEMTGEQGEDDAEDTT